MKLLLETAGTMEWEIVGLFDSVEEIDEWIKENWDVTFQEYKQHCLEEDAYEPTREEWYEEIELRVREVPIIKKEPKHIAVICLNKNDFNNWKKENIIKENIRYERSYEFMVGVTKYYALCNNVPICSLALDSIIETDYAHENKYYNEIKAATISALKQNL